MTLVLAYLLNVTDYFFTKYWITRYGIDAEFNPIGRWMFATGLAGFIKIFIIGGLFILLGYLVKRQPKASIANYLAFCVYGVVVAYHIALAIGIR